MKHPKLLLNYVKPCLEATGLKIEKLPKYYILKKIKTVHRTREYFFSIHNRNTLEKIKSLSEKQKQRTYNHLALPYKITEINHNSEGKIKAFNAAGVPVAEKPDEIPGILKELI